MEKSHSSTIKELLNYLPKSEVHYAEKYYNLRDFQSLKEIVDSTIFKIKKNLSSDSIKDEYLSIDLDSLYTLQTKVTEYLSLLDEIEEEDEDFTDEDIENYEYNKFI